ncbi:MAG: thioesterase domain-containing protein [Minicystis sp.]
MTAPDPTATWIVKKPRPAARLRLFCFPYSGGGASSFRGWADAMPSLEVCAIQAPGRETRMREPAFVRMEPLVADLTKAIRPLLDRPFAFFGHSLGSFVAFETARALRREGAPLPRHLFLSGCPSPQTHVIEHPIHDLDDAKLVEAIRRYQGTPDEVMKNDELMKLVLPLLRSDFTIYETYAPPSEPPFDIPITALGGLQDDHATREQLDGWRAHTTKSFVLRMFPGGHFFVHAVRSQLLGTVLQDLAPHLR